MARSTTMLTLAAGLICIGAAGLLVRSPLLAPPHRFTNAYPVLRHARPAPTPRDDSIVPVAAPNPPSPAPRAPARPAPGTTASAASDADAPGELEPDAILPLARLALSYVGTDPVAEAFWEAAINDPTLDADSRKDLIEDLNEDGFADPHNLTASDLPLIDARLAIIDRLAPTAMDDVNAEAFKEARKDLLGMRAKLIPTSSPAPTPPFQAAPASPEPPHAGGPAAPEHQ